MKTGRANGCVREGEREREREREREKGRGRAGARRVAGGTSETTETSSLATLTARLGDIYFIYLLIFRSFVRFARAFIVLDRLTWIRAAVPFYFFARSRSIPFKPSPRELSRVSGIERDRERERERERERVMAARQRFALISCNFADVSRMHKWCRWSVAVRILAKRSLRL